MHSTQKTHPVLGRDGQAIVSGGRYLCVNPLEMVVVERLPAGPGEPVICRNEQMVCRHIAPSRLAGSPDEQKKIVVANTLWQELADIPVDEDDQLDAPFLHFEKGEDKEAVWHWFESEFGLSVAEDLMGVA
ncbi:hypothetical protein [Marinobacter sp. P4B1]|uniref:hypothetical protein n=1 Tax=Marinobacter sp. P4B1 TaxID=1119533 RepID=UPI000AAF0898|nr:hypothetical protein [Marinobacter sp. P4B1]